MTLAEVRGRIVAAAERSGRDPDDIVLVAVTKGQPVERIMEAYRDGHRDFGENRAQQLVAKVGRVPGDARWHFVGRLQRNKVRQVRPAVVLLHALDRMALAPAWLKGPGAAPPALVQVNIGREPQKAGFDPAEVVAAVEQLVALGVAVRGLMCLPPQRPNAEEVRPFFRELAALREEVQAVAPDAVELSMGMTDDFEVAVEEGSTMVRIGRAIFGAYAIEE